ncbi:hypothetical protein N0V90_008537 [Kalmusia sp. IMI 367209]|nr:hypothetical protein N0V90_008537 [Kalmusia sp. IMI 367209]
MSSRKSDYTIASKAINANAFIDTDKEIIIKTILRHKSYLISKRDNFLLDIVNHPNRADVYAYLDQLLSLDLLKPD